MGSERKPFVEAMEFYASLPRPVLVVLICVGAYFELYVGYNLVKLGSEALSPQPKAKDIEPTLTVAPYVPPQADPQLIIPTEPFTTFALRTAEPNNQALADQINAQIQEALHTPLPAQAPYASPTPPLLSDIALYAPPNASGCVVPNGEVHALEPVYRNHFRLTGADTLAYYNTDPNGIVTVLGMTQDGKFIRLNPYDGSFYSIDCP